MNNQKKHFRLGLFVLLSLLVCLGLMIGLGAGKWLTPSVKLETYFDESVQGIDVGSKIRYRGVVVGEVSEVGFTYTHYEQDKNSGQRYQYVMVTAKIQPTLFSGKKFAMPDQANLNAAAARGLRIRLTPQGLTGTSYLEMDFVNPKENPVLPISWTPDNLYIPSGRSTVKQFVSGAQELMTRLQRVDLENTITRLNRLLETTEKKLDAVPVENISKNLDQFSSRLAKVPVDQIASEATSLLVEVRASNKQLQKMLNDPAMASAPADIGITARKARELMENPELTQTVSKLNQSLGRLDRLLGTRDQEIAETLDNLNDISKNLKSVSETAEQNPSGLLFGAPPKPYEPPR